MHVSVPMKFFMILRLFFFFVLKLFFQCTRSEKWEQAKEVKQSSMASKRHIIMQKKKNSIREDIQLIHTAL